MQSLALFQYKCKLVKYVFLYIEFGIIEICDAYFRLGFH